MRLTTWVSATVLGGILAIVASDAAWAQASTPDWAVRSSDGVAPANWTIPPVTPPSATARPTTVSDLITELNRRAVDETGSRAFGDTATIPVAPSVQMPSVAYVASTRDVWLDGSGFTDRLRVRTAGALRRSDGLPLPLNPQDTATFEGGRYDVSYTRGWETYLGETRSGLDVTLIPHAGLGVGTSGGVAEAGATLRIGSGLERLVPDGQDAFGERARWYLYAAGSGRAVGYNFARTRDGDFARSGVSHDSGNFLGDASVGVAYRRGAMQGSFGVVYREVEINALYNADYIDNDVSEGLVAFQLSIKPEW